MRGEGQQSNEGPCIGKEDLREVQGHQPPWGGSRDLRERKAQAAPGLVGPAMNGNLHQAGSPEPVASSWIQRKLQTTGCKLQAKTGLVSLSQGLR